MTELSPAPRSITFQVRGKPVCQGSKIGMVVRGRAVLIESGNKKTKTMPANRLKHWREAIAANALRAMSGQELWFGAIVLDCEFIMPRSPGHYTSKGALKKGAPVIPTNDYDKMFRAVGDSLSGVVYGDDVQIVGPGPSRKRFASKLSSTGGVIVTVSEVGPGNPRKAKKISGD